MKRIIDRIGWALAGALAVMVVLLSARAIQAGPLDPPGPVSSTMKTLDDVSASWDRILVSNDNADSCNTSRFKCVLGGQAVLDRETGLVWQRTPPSGTEFWLAAAEDCMNFEIGGRYGWRLATIQEYRTLQTTVDGGVPVGSPFSNILTGGNDYYWSSTTYPFDSTYVYAARFDTVHTDRFQRNSLSSLHPWCVRGGAGTDGTSP